MLRIMTVIVLISIICILSAEDNSRDVFAKLNYHNFLSNYSARNVAMGFISGTSNVWGATEMEQGNPALLGYLKGLSHRFSFSSNKYTEIAESSLSFGFKGLGFTLPIPSNNWKFGFVQQYKYSMYGEEVFGPTGEDFEFFSSSQKFSFGLNLYDVLTNYSLLTPKERHMEFSFGFTMRRQSMEFIISDSPDYKLDFWTQDYGLNFLLDFFKTIDKELPIDLAFSAGIHAINPTKRKARFDIDNDGDGLVNEDPFDMLDNDGDGLIDEDREEMSFTTNNDNRVGFCLHFNLPISSSNNLSEISFLNHFSKSIVNATVTTDIGIEFQSTGLEITIFDIFSYRTGRYDENTGNSTYDDSYKTNGFGLQLKDNVFALKGNLTMISGGSVNLPEKLYEISINLNLLHILGKRI